MLESLPSLLGIAVLAATAYLAYRHYLDLNYRRKLPPGPKPLPIVGNILDLPPSGMPEYQHWLHHKDKYGPVSSITVMGMTLIIMHDEKAIHEILQRKIGKTSGRPRGEFASGMCGYERIPGIRTNDIYYRHARKFINQELGSKALSSRFDDAIETESRWQLVQSLNKPEKWLSHVKSATGAAVLKTTYGYNLDRNNPDLLVTMIDKGVEELADALRPLARAVDFIPALRHLPDWFPGTGFKKVAREYRKTWEIAAYTPYRFVERQLASNTHRPSLVSRLIEEYRPKGDKTARLNSMDEWAVAWAGTGLYLGAMDSSAAVFETFTLAMLLYPEVQRKGQEEIDRVIGRDRFPGLEDRAQLPYINGIVKEILRWWTVGPMGLQHMAEEDIEYDGLLIPKGAILMPAVWWLAHDPAVHPNPEVFDPERYISPRNEKDPALHLFGYGRRRCPGEFMADTRLYLNVSNSLAAFYIKKATNPDGTEIPVLCKPKPGAICLPEKFQFQIVPRSQKHTDMIKEIAANYTSDKSDVGSLKVVES